MPKISKMVVMELDNSPNIEITEDMISHSLKTFINAPVVKGYTANRHGVTIYSSESVVGVINNVDFTNKKVVADILWWDEDYSENGYKNWMIRLVENEIGFIFDSVEIN